MPCILDSGWGRKKHQAALDRVNVQQQPSSEMYKEKEGKGKMCDKVCEFKYHAEQKWQKRNEKRKKKVKQEQTISTKMQMKSSWFLLTYRWKAIRSTCTFHALYEFTLRFLLEDTTYQHTHTQTEMTLILPNWYYQQMRIRRKIA